MAREIQIFNEYEKFVTALSGSGAFLITGKDKPNPMTIGWATLGVIWGRPIMTVLVRPSRHSFLLINSHDEFVVSVPTTHMAKELAFCGTKSGRDFDKFKECKLAAAPGIKVAVPHIAECALHYECKIVHKNNVIPENLDMNITPKYYPKGDFHTIYYGEVLGTFFKE